jgi:hypothetical protein
MRTSSSSSSSSSFALRPSSFVLFSLLLSLYLLTLGGHFYSPDEEILGSVTSAIAERHSLAIAPIVAGFGTRPADPPRPDGREYAQYGVGQPLLALPFHYLGGALHALASDAAWNALADRLRSNETVIAQTAIALQAPPEYRPQATPERARETARRLALSLFNPLVTALSALVLLRLARRLTGDRRAAWLAALAWGAGSLAWPHARTFFTEPLAGLCLLLALERLARLFCDPGVPPACGAAGVPPASCGAGVPPASCGAGVPPASCGAGVPPALDTDTPPAPPTPPPALHPRATLLALLTAGLAAGYGCLVRVDSIFFLPALALLVLWGDYPAREQGWNPRALVRHVFRSRLPFERVALFALPIFLAGCTILAINQAEFGSFLASGYSAQSEGINFSTPLLAGLYGFLFSVGKGLFFFSPALVLALWGVRPMLRRRPIFGAAIVALFVGFLCVMSTWQNWAGGWCWGPRHIMQIHALLALPLAFWLVDAWNRARRIAFAALLVVGAAVQVYGSSQSFFDYYTTFYRDPTPPNAMPLWTPGEMPLRSELAIVERDAKGRPTARELPPQWTAQAFHAPINDSIYIVQNSQWPGYARLWRERGTNDFFWLHLFDGPEGLPSP